MQWQSQKTNPLVWCRQQRKCVLDLGNFSLLTSYLYGHLGPTCWNICFFLVFIHLYCLYLRLYSVAVLYVCCFCPLMGSTSQNLLWKNLVQPQLNTIFCCVIVFSEVLSSEWLFQGGSKWSIVWGSSYLHIGSSYPWLPYFCSVTLDCLVSEIQITIDKESRDSELEGRIFDNVSYNFSIEKLWEMC